MGKTLIVWALAFALALGGAWAIKAHGDRQFEKGWEAGYGQARTDWTKPCLPDETISGTRER